MRPSPPSSPAPRRAVLARGPGPAAALGPIALGAALLGCPEPRVVRVVEGHEIEGRFVSDRAYSLYAIASVAEAHGDLPTALHAYTAASAEDDESAEIWTRIGAVLCASRPPEQARAHEAFARAEQLDASYEPLWRERATCELASKRAGPALAAAERAVQLDPDRDAAVVVHAAALDAAGRPDDALRTLEAAAIRHPTSVAVYRALYEHALRRGSTATAERAARRLRAMVPRLAPDLERALPSLGATHEIDAAILAGDLSRARRRALEAHIRSAEIALRAAALGRAPAAREQAELVLGADPADLSARIALAVAADLERDDALLARALSAFPEGSAEPAPPSPLASLLFAELLHRRVGADAARAWLGPLPPAPPADGLYDHVAGRVQELLAR